MNGLWRRASCWSCKHLAFRSNRKVSTVTGAPDDASSPAGSVAAPRCSFMSVVFAGRHRSANRTVSLERLHNLLASYALHRGSRLRCSAQTGRSLESSRWQPGDPSSVRHPIGQLVDCPSFYRKNSGGQISVEQPLSYPLRRHVPRRFDGVAFAHALPVGEQVPGTAAGGWNSSSGTCRRRRA